MFLKNRIKTLELTDYFFCYLDVDDCKENSCSEREKCVDGINSFSCECKTPFVRRGKLCGKPKPG